MGNPCARVAPADQKPSKPWFIAGTWSDPTPEHVQRLAAAGHKIPAIKMYREINRVGLKEVKDAVENMGGP